MLKRTITGRKYETTLVIIPVLMVDNIIRSITELVLRHTAAHGIINQI
jgi:hypothetical protein